MRGIAVWHVSSNGDDDDRGSKVFSFDDSLAIVRSGREVVEPFMNSTIRIRKQMMYIAPTRRNLFWNRIIDIRY